MYMKRMKRKNNGDDFATTYMPNHVQTVQLYDSHFPPYNN